MCGRNSLFPPASLLEPRFDATVAVSGYEPRYNIAPGEGHPAITSRDPESIVSLRWGFEVPWTDGTNELINARSEIVDDRPAFADAWSERPCLVPSSGFDEWGSGRPYRIHRPDDAVFALAGLWNPGSNGGELTILTTAANQDIAGIHDRMPVVLPRSEESTWMRASTGRRSELCRPYERNDLVVTPIGPAVNDPANDHPGIIAPAEQAQSHLDRFE